MSVARRIRPIRSVRGAAASTGWLDARARRGTYRAGWSPWRRKLGHDGSELFTCRRSPLMAVSVRHDTMLEVGTPRRSSTFQGRALVRLRRVKGWETVLALVRRPLPASSRSPSILKTGTAAGPPVMRALDESGGWGGEQWCHRGVFDGISPPST